MYVIESFAIDKKLNKKHFVEKYAENVHQSLVRDHFFNFDKSKTTIACNKFFQKVTMFSLSNNFKKVNFDFSFVSSPFSWTIIQLKNK